MTRSSTLGRPAAIGVALALATLVSGASSTASAQGDVTFTKDVAPIIFENCVSCHRPGQTAPMPLRSYAEVRPWARGIKEQVESGAMPPWFADARHGFFKNDMRLVQDEIDTITRWVDAGAPQGAPSDLPELPTFTDGWQLGEPDLIVNLNEVTVPAVCEGNTEGSGGLRSARLNAAGAAEGGSSGAGCVGGDYYPDLNHTLDIPEKRWIRAIEVKPSNRKVTHHSVIFTTGGAAQGASRSGFFDVLAVWSVGTNPHEFPEGSGRWVYPGQTWNINAHYHPTGEVETDRTQIGLYFGEGEMQKEVVAALAGAAALVAFGVLNVRQAFQAVDPKIVTTIASALALGVALQETGGARYLAHGLVTAFQGASPATILPLFFLLVAGLSNIISTKTAAVLFTPIAVDLAIELGVEPHVFAVAVIFAANCSFASPLGYQTNLLVMGPGHYKFTDFARAGLPLIVLLWAAFSLFAPWYYGI